MILAAGKGSRLKEITKSIPKPLVRLSDKVCMIDNVVEKLTLLGVKEIGVNLHTFGEQIEQHLKTRFSKVSWQFFHEPELLNTGGAIANAKNFLIEEENALIINADILFTFELKPIYEEHQASGQLISLLLASQKGRERAVLYNEKNEITGFTNTKGENLFNLTANTSKKEYFATFTGIQFIRKEFLERLKPGCYSIIETYADYIRSGGMIKAVLIKNGYWQDLGTIKALEKGRQIQLKIEKGETDFNPATFI